MNLWKQIGPGKYARSDSSSGASVRRSSHDQPMMSRSEITSLIDAAIAEALSKQTSHFENTELTQQSFTDLKTTVKELSDEFQDFKETVLKRLEENERRLEKLHLRCDRIEKAASEVSDEQRSLNTILQIFQKEFCDSNIKLAKRFETFEENLKSLVEKEIECQNKRDNLHQNRHQKQTRENVSKMQMTGFEKTIESGGLRTLTRESSDGLDKEDGVWPSEKPIRDRVGVQSPTDFSRVAKVHQSPLESDSHIPHSERNLESMVELEQLQLKEFKPSGLVRKNKFETGDKMTIEAEQTISSASSLQLETEFKGKQFGKIPTAIRPRDAAEQPMSLDSRLELMSLDSKLALMSLDSRLELMSLDSKLALMSLDSRLEDDLKENQFIKIPIATLSKGDEQLMSLDSRLEYETLESQFIEIPKAALSRYAKQLMSFDTRLKDNNKEDQFIKIPIAGLSREAEQPMSLDSRLEDDLSENHFIEIPIAALSIYAKQLRPMSFDSRSADDVIENQFIKIPIAEFSTDAEQPMSLDSRLEEDSSENQFIRIPTTAFTRHAEKLITVEGLSRDAKQLKSPDSGLEDDNKKNQFIRIPIAGLSRDAEQLMSLDSRLEDDSSENHFIKIPTTAFTRYAEKLMSLGQKLRVASENLN